MSGPQMQSVPARRCTANTGTWRCQLLFGHSGEHEERVDGEVRCWTYLDRYTKPICASKAVTAYLVRLAADKAKPPMHLVLELWPVLEAIALHMAAGNARPGRERGDWRNLVAPLEHFAGKIGRHQARRTGGELLDEDGRMHSIAVATNALYQAALDLEGKL